MHRAFLFSEPAVLVLPKKLNAEAPVTWDYLRFCGLPRVSNFIGTSNGDFETEYLTKLGLNFVDKIMVEQPLPLITCIAKGLAWGILDPTTIALFPNLHDKLAFFPLPERQPCRELFVLSRNEEIFRTLADTVLTTAAGCLTELVRNKISEFAPWVPQMCWVPASETQQRIRGRGTVGTHSPFLSKTRIPTEKTIKAIPTSATKEEFSLKKTIPMSAAPTGSISVTDAATAGVVVWKPLKISR